MTEADRTMLLQGMGHDVTDYRNQLRDLKKGRKPAIVTQALGFGCRGHWNAQTSLIELREIPEVLEIARWMGSGNFLILLLFQGSGSVSRRQYIKSGSEQS